MQLNGIPLEKLDNGYLIYREPFSGNPEKLVSVFKTLSQEFKMTAIHSMVNQQKERVTLFRLKNKFDLCDEDVLKWLVDVTVTLEIDFIQSELRDKNQIDLIETLENGGKETEAEEN